MNFSPGRRLSLSTKFILLTGLLIIVTAVIIGLFVIRNEVKHTYQNLLNHGRSVAAIIAQNSQYGIYTGDKTALRQIVDSIDRDPDIAYLFIMDEKHRVLMHKPVFGYLLGIPERLSYRNSPETGRILSQEFLNTEDGQKYIDVLAPVESQPRNDPTGYLLDAPDSMPKIIGHIQLGLTEAGLRQRIREFLFATLLFTSFIVSLGVVITIFITRRIVHPIKELNRATRDIALGRLDTHVAIKTKDEIADLAEAFNNMLERLKTSREEVEKHTFELMVTNDKISQEISVRKQAEAQLMSTKARLENLLVASTAVIYSCVPSAFYRMTFISENVKLLLGYEPHEITGDKDFWPQHIHKKDVEYVLQEWGIFMARERHNYEYRIIDRDGNYRWIHDELRLLYDREDNPTEIVGTLVDITKRKDIEEKIRQSEQFIRSILDTVDEGFIVVDRDFRILTANKAYCDQVGGVCADIIGRHCHEISHKASLPCHEGGKECAVLRVFETGEPCSATHRHRDQKGVSLFVETKAFPIKDISGTVVSVIETVNNITEKHLLEEERLKTQKLESIGRLAGGIAHDFNNLLQGVFGYISMAKMYLDHEEDALTMLEQAEKALRISVNLTSQLLTFSKGGMPVKKRIALRSLIEDSAKFALSGSRSNYTLTCDATPRMVEADEGQIGQVIQNIVLNADQAMPMGGTISVVIKNVDAPAKDLPLSLTAGEYVEITIADNGIGIPEQHLSRIFDPYFTTKDKGSGLGLATSYSIIKNHGGLIEVKSKLGSGTTIVVYIPAIDGYEAKNETIPARPAVAKTGKILVMDDEEVVRNIVGIMITSLGHEVEFAKNGEEAVAKYREALSLGRPFKIVILDLTIRGGKGGEATMQELIALDPEVTAIVSSGYSDNAVLSEYRSYGFRACLTKPYEIGTLEDTINAMLK